MSPQRSRSPDDAQARVRYETRGRVAYVVLDRPHKLNAMDERMHEELRTIWDEFERDDNVWLGVLSGAGDQAFSVGQDLHELAEKVKLGAAPTSFGSRGRSGWPRLTEPFSVSKPLIACVSGYAYGGGMELAMACDIIVAGENASFALPEAKLGLIPGAGGLFRLTRQIPFRVALGYLMTGQPMSAKRAFQLGLVNEVVPTAELHSAVDRWVTDILRCAPLSVRAVKQVALSSMHLSLEEAFSGHYEAEEVRCNSQDCREGPTAFVEKRTPNWIAR